MTTHYLDEAERCHRVAIIHAGRLAALGTTTELKRHLRRPADRRDPRRQSGRRDARRSTRMPEVEKTSLFGTAVHAVLRERRRQRRRRCARACRAAGVAVESIAPVAPSLEDVFLDVVDRAGGAARMRKALAVGRKELRQIARDRRTLLILLFVPGVLPAALRLRAELRHPPRRARRRGSRRHAREPRARVGVRELRLLRPRGRRLRSPREAERLLDLNDGARRAGDSRGLRPRRRRRAERARCRCSSTATTRTPRRR